MTIALTISALSLIVIGTAGVIWFLIKKTNDKCGKLTDSEDQIDDDIEIIVKEIQEEDSIDELL